MKHVLAVLLVCLSGCSPEPAETPDAPAPESTPPAAQPSPVSPDRAAANVLTPEGLGALRIGQPVPANSGWAERGAQISDACRTVSSPDFPGVYAIVEEGLVRRITIGERSDVKLAEGIGVGAAEAEVRVVFPNLGEEPHFYIGPPAKYLTAPDAASGAPALRFETGADGKVSLIHAGTIPVLGYVEACA